MPRKKIPSSHEPAHSQQPVCAIRRDLREGPEEVAGDVAAGAAEGLDPLQVTEDWLGFASKAGHLRVTGQRSFRSDLERIEVMEEEAKSLFAFARSLGRGLPEAVKERTQNNPFHLSGSEHRVFFNVRSADARVLKITFPDKFGRKEHTPFQYLERWGLMSQLVPATRGKFEDCIMSQAGTVSIVMSMPFFAGPHPSPEEAHSFITDLGFELWRDGSTTLDYIDRATGLILRDCHPTNWIKADGGLVPIDIIPELV